MGTARYSEISGLYVVIAKKLEHFYNNLLCCLFTDDETMAVLQRTDGEAGGSFMTTLSVSVPMKTARVGPEIFDTDA
jgi:hypothetical protein